MASKRIKQGDVEWQMFKDYWILVQQFWEPENNDEYWEQLNKAADEFHFKYPNEILARKIAGAFVESLGIKLENKMKERKNGFL